MAYVRQRGMRYVASIAGPSRPRVRDCYSDFRGRHHLKRARSQPLLAPVQVKMLLNLLWKQMSAKSIGELMLTRIAWTWQC